MTFDEYYDKDYAKFLSKTTAKKMYSMYLETQKVSTDMNLNIPSTCTTIGFGIGPLEMQAAQCKPSVPCQQGNKPMYIHDDKHIESSKINYLNGRLEATFYTARGRVPAAFHTDIPKVPETPEALIEAITSGNYTLPPKNERNDFDRAINQIVWRSPSIVPDKDGADKAYKEIEDLNRKALDTIMIGTPEAALTAIQALDNYLAQ